MPEALDVEPAQYLNLNLFPSEVTIGDSEKPLLGEYKTIVTNNYLYVITDGVEGPEFVVKEPLTSFEGTGRTGYTVVTETETYLIRRAKNCGCGSRLRSLRVFTGVPHIQQLK